MFFLDISENIRADSVRKQTIYKTKKMTPAREPENYD